MTHRTFDEQIANFNRVVSSWDIDQEYKVALLGMIASLGYEHEKSINPEPHWIPWTGECDLMDNEEVLVCQKYGQIRHAMFYDFACKKKFVTWEEGITIYDVVAYMPLPEPYKGVTDGRN